MVSSKPVITRSQVVAQTRLFQVEQIGLRFNNGNEVEYERLRSPGRGAVLVIPVLDDETVFLIREYVAGMDRYEISFPKGVIDPGETPEQAAGREIKEEVGYGANKLRLLRELSVAPGYSDYRTYIILATDLYKQKLPGDEPEEIEVVPWRMGDLSRLLQRKDFVEARSIAALYLLQHAL
jgi:ADP-ribose diphosphatase